MELENSAENIALNRTRAGVAERTVNTFYTALPENLK
jgi:hypothetical protein